MRTRAPLLLLAVAVLSACGDDGDEREMLTAEEVRLEIVSGDRQSAPVASATAQMSSMGTAAALTVELLPEPLIVQLVDTASGEPVASIVATSSNSSLLEPSVSYSGHIPENLLVRFRVIEEGCGEAFIGTALPDSGQVIDRWIKGTLAGDCHMEVARLIDGEPHTDTTFLWHAEPGPIAQITMEVPSWTQPGDTLDIMDLLTSDRITNVGLFDAHGNRISGLEDRTYGWAWTEGADIRPSGPEGSGHLVEIPDPEARGWEADYMGEYVPRLWIWVDGTFDGHGVGVRIKVM